MTPTGGLSALDSMGQRLNTAGMPWFPVGVFIEPQIPATSARLSQIRHRTRSRGHPTSLLGVDQGEARRGCNVSPPHLQSTRNL